VLSDTGGIDTVESDVSWTLADGFENLTVTGTLALQLTGNNGANLLVGNAGGNFFNPRGGNDTIDGGPGTGNDWVRLGGGGVPTYGTKVIDLGSGLDTLDFGGFGRSAIVVDLAAGTLRGGGDAGQGSATLIGIEQVIGDGFNDRLSGSFAAESLNGGGGNDTLDGRGGNDTLTGGLGADTFAFSTAPGTGTGNVDGVTDFVSGTDKLSFDNNVFTALGASGNFTAGDARFAAGAGFTSGREAGDRLIYNTTTGQLFYDADGNGAGPAQLVATLQGAPVLAATDIMVTGRAGIVGTPGNDSLVGTEGNDSIDGLGGNDTIDGRGGDDTLNGGSGTDLVLGGAGNDTLIDTDLLAAGAAPDTLDGGLGNDTYDLHTDNFFPFPPTVLRDAGGVDTVLAEGFTLPEGFENLILFARDTDIAVRGTGNSSNNVITVSGSREASGDTIDGADGDDTLIGGLSGEVFTFVAGSGNYGHDSVDGGASGGLFEFDVLSFEGARSAVVVDMRTGIATGGGVAGSGSVTFTSIDEVRGGGFDDRLTARDGVPNPNPFGDVIGARLSGGAGNDTLTGGAASDTLTGGAGQDNFVFAVPPAAGNVDQVSDFGSGSDKLVFDNGAFTAIGGAGNFAAGDARFAAGAGFTSGRDASDRIVYNTTTGELFYDADGNGAGAAQLVATLLGAPALAATDIVVTGQAQPNPNSIQGTASSDSLTGTTGNDLIEGFGGNDTLRGLAGDDTLDAGTGEDSLFGGPGNDTYIVDGFGDNVFENAGEGIDTLRVSMSAGMGSEIENLILTGSAAIDGGGNQLDNVITGNSAANTLFGNEGNDTLAGGLGQDRFQFVDGSGVGTADLLTDFVSGTDKIELRNNVFSEVGSLGNFAAGDSRFAAGAGFNSGRDASDRVIYNTSTGQLFYDADGSGAGASSLIATLQGAPSLVATDVAVFGFGAASRGTAGNDSLTGTAGDDNLEGLAGNDTLIGLAGDDFLDAGTGGDSLVGGTGNDNYVVDGPGDTVMENPGEGFDTVLSSTSRTLDANVEGLTLTGTALSGTGNALDNSIQGNSAANSLAGGEGNDILNGSLGQDTFVFATAPGISNEDQISDFESGVDQVSLDNAVFTQLGTAGNFTVGDARFAAGPGLDSGQDASDRVIYNTTSGQLFYDADGNGAGAAQIIATLQFGRELTATDIVVTGQAQPNPGQGTPGNDSLTGTAGDDLLQGLAGNDTLNGLAGNDTLDAGTGGDLLIGGTGNDEYIVDGPGDTVVENAGEGNDTIMSSASRTLDANVENLTLTGTAAINGTGNALNNSIFGNSAANVLSGGDGNDLLQGGAGIDTMNGGLGDDLYFVEAGDILSDPGGIDTVFAGINWTLADGFENLTVTTHLPVNVTGNNGANVLTGNSGNEFFNPRGGNDTISGDFGNDWVRLGGGGVPSYGNKVIDLGLGADTLDFGGFGRSAIVVDLAAGTLSGGGDAGQGSATLTSIEQVIGDGFNDRLSGSAGNETLNGGGGNDTLEGRGGNDTLTGGLGQDAFVFASAPGAGNEDVITDFVSATDKANFENGVFTGLGAAGNFVAGDARFAAGAGFTSGRDASDRIIHNTSSGQLFYDADGSGAGAAQLIATFLGNPAITARDITVI
jgi:Ca2+-binding RTX toxin-like protein